MDSPVEIIDLTRSKSRSVPPEPDVIPPCRVCGEKASGLHYGKITCHGCKGFFRRSLTRRDKYTCKQGNNRCGISRAVEVKLCQYCRFQRCLAVGMSKQAIRSGRYTYAMRTKNLQEARGLDNTELSTTATTRLTPASSDSRDSGLGSPPLLSILSTDLESDSVVSTSNSDPSSTRSLSERDKEFELEKVITNITDCHKMFSDYAHLIENSDELQAQQERFYELAKLKETMFGELKALSRAEYRDFFQVTGIDVDDRRKTTIEFMEYMQRHIMGQVEFAKRIQGFADIPLVDQCSLIKGSFYEMSLFDGHRTYNSDLDVKVLHDGMAFQPQEICFLDNYELWSERKEFEKSLNTMQLDVTETALIKAIVLLFTDRRPLDVPIYVENLQLNIINAFRHYLRRTNSNFNKRFANIWSKITHVRTISLLHEEARRNCMMDFPEVKDFPLFHDTWKI